MTGIAKALEQDLTASIRVRPIIFTAESVRAILDGRKTQTRRVINPQPADISFALLNGIPLLSTGIGPAARAHNAKIKNRYGQPGDRLWVKETWEMDPNEYGWDEGIRRDFVTYRADQSTDYTPWWGWNSSLFMPRWASRLTLQIENVWVERLQDISEDNATKEGVPYDEGHGWWYNGNVCARYGFQDLWDSINEKRGYPWSSNPWVWVIDFEMVR